RARRSRLRARGAGAALQPGPARGAGLYRSKPGRAPRPGRVARRNPAEPGWRRRAGVLARLQQLLCHHPLQHLQALRDGGVPAGRGDRRSRPAGGERHRRGARRGMIRALAVLLVLGLAACSSAPRKADPAPAGRVGVAGTSEPRRSPYPPAQEDRAKRGDYTAGGLYAPHIADAAPDIDIQVDLIPEPEVVAEPRSRYGNRPTYTVLGREYKVLDDPSGYVEKGIASYYGTKFHGRRTSNMEVYDMYAFTAAHKHLPLPSFARVTNLDNGRSVVVRVNDRGPFHEGRVIDLSYAAAVKLGIHPRGTGNVEVRALLPGEEAPAVASVH